MQKIKYLLCQRVNIGTEEEPKYEEVLYGKKLPYSEANLELAKAEAYNGEYEVYDDGIKEWPFAPRNIVEGEYFSINGVLYKATMNIPSGEFVIVGQNASATTVEEQLYELK